MDFQRSIQHRGALDNSDPLYGIVDALGAFDRFGRDVQYDRPFDLAPGVRVTFVNAGHILGSASIFLELAEGEIRRTLGQQFEL